MAENGIQSSNPGQPSFEISSNDGLPEVLQYADWYVAGRGDNEPHHRYNRYMSRLRGHPVPSKRQAHVDIGSGTGLFSWTFLDWAAENGIAFDRLDLYGLDHCQAMIDVAEMARIKLAKIIINYPTMNYCNDVDLLLPKITKNHQYGTDYLVTFGYVLIQANTPQNIHEFARVIAHIASS